MRANVVLVAGLAGVLLGSGVVAQKALKDESGKVSFTLPAGWSIREKQLRTSKVENDHANYTAVQLMAVSKTHQTAAELTLTVTNESHFRLVSAVEKMRVLLKSTTGVEKVQVESAPLHYVHAAKKGEQKLVLAKAVLPFVGRSAQFSLRCLESKWEAVKPDFLKMAQSVKVDLPVWPPHPSGRSDKASGGIVFSLAPSLKKSRALREIQKCVKDQEKTFKKLHGANTRSKAEPLRIYINELRADHKLIAQSKEVAEVVSEPSWHRFFTTPLGKRGVPGREAFVAALQHNLLVEAYGLDLPLWFLAGEQGAAEQADTTKKPMPAVDKALLATIVVSRTLEKLAGMRKVDNTFHRECLAYVGMFHAGPKEYREAYGKFLAEARKTSDPAGAAKKHLLSMDQDAMKAEVQAFVKKMRGVKIKR